MANYLLKIGGTDITRFITGYKVQYCKLWSSDTGRSMTGENKGTLIGIFPKLIIGIGRQTDAERSTLLSYFNKASASVTYYDTEKKQYVTNSFYFGDAEDELLRMKNMSHKPMEISIIANKKRGQL